MKTRLYILLLMSFMLLTQTGCIYDSDSTIPCDSEEKGLLVINLDLTVPSSSVGTRSAYHMLDPGTDAESYINIADEDYRVLMFDKDGNLIEGKLSEFKCKENGIRNGVVSYTLTAELRISSNEDREKLSKFKLMVLANWKSFENSNTQPNYIYPTFKDCNIITGADKNIFKNETDFNFKLKQGGAWEPALPQKTTKAKAIPMFGITDELDLQRAMDMSKYGDGPSFNVPMLRAMAKVEIIDELKERISGVHMSNANQSGRFIPIIDENTNTNVDWNKEEFQITTPSLPAAPGNIDKIEFVQGPVTPEGNRTWVAYIPEMDFTIEGQQRPQMTIYDASSELESKPFNNYEGGQVVTDQEKFLSYVLRNHIYSFRVTITDKAKVSMELEVLPWDMEYDDTPSYFDSPKVADNGYLTWKTTYEGDVENEEQIGQSNGFLDDEENLILTMKPTIDEFVEATFTLKAPKNCRWYAQLATLDGKEDAFYFVDADGNAIVTADGKPGNPEGIIGKSGDNCIIDSNGNTQCTIRIKNRSEQVNDRNNEMKLVIFIEYPDKNLREVKVAVVKDNEGNIIDWGNYTIVQKQTNIYG